MATREEIAWTESAIRDKKEQIKEINKEIEKLEKWKEELKVNKKKLDELKVRFKEHYGTKIDEFNDTYWKCIHEDNRFNLIHILPIDNKDELMSVIEYIMQDPLTNFRNFDDMSIEHITSIIESDDRYHLRINVDKTSYFKCSDEVIEVKTVKEKYSLLQFGDYYTRITKSEYQMLLKYAIDEFLTRTTGKV